MELHKVKRNWKKNRSIVMSIRISPEISEFMKENDISPSLVFHSAIEELMKIVEKKRDKE